MDYINAVKNMIPTQYVEMMYKSDEKKSNPYDRRESLYSSHHPTLQNDESSSNDQTYYDYFKNAFAFQTTNEDEDENKKEDPPPTLVQKPSPSHSKHRYPYNNYKQTYPPRIQKRTDSNRKLKNHYTKKKKKSSNCCFYCCCCLTSKWGRWLCCIILVTAIIGIVIGLVIVIPRLPKFKVISLAVDQDTPDYKAFQLIANDPSDKTNVTVELRLTLTVNVSHANFFALKANQISLDTYLIANTTALQGSGIPGSSQISMRTAEELDPLKKRLIGTGYSTDLIFPPNQMNQFQIPFILSYTPKPETGGLTGDLIFSEIYQACGLDGKRGRTMQIESQVTIDVDFFSNFGFRPSIPDSVNVFCPFSRSHINGILASFGFPQLPPITKKNRLSSTSSNAS